MYQFVTMVTEQVVLAPFNTFKIPGCQKSMFCFGGFLPQGGRENCVRASDEGKKKKQRRRFTLSGASLNEVPVRGPFVIAALEAPGRLARPARCIFDVVR